MGKSQYIIQFGGLPVGIHEFEFNVTDKFFKSVENSEIEKADVKVTATLTKQNNLLNMEFDIEGVVGIECDRCLKEFGYPVKSHEKLVIKHGNPQESTDEILVIKEGEAEFDIAQYIYEYIVLAVPVRKVPCEIDEERFECDDATLEKLEKVSTDKEKDDSEIVNPVWEQLKKLKKNNKN
jgi:uncharacterized protein